MRERAADPVFGVGGRSPACWPEPSPGLRHWAELVDGSGRGMSGVERRAPDRPPNGGMLRGSCRRPRTEVPGGIRKCSPGCDVCRNLKPGQGPDTDFGMVRQPRDGTAYAATDGPWLLGGYDTRFDRDRICADANMLAKVMVHEATHACRAAGGTKDLRDEQDPLKLGTPGCYADKDVAPFEGGRQCGDPR